MKKQNRPKLGIAMINRGIKKLDALWWCGGREWQDRDYRALFIAPASYRARAIVAELRGDTPRALSRRIRQEGLHAPSLAKIAALCESAPRSPRAIP